MRMGELSKALGVPDYTLRRLAQKGIIPSKKLPVKKAHRHFTEADVEGIRRILIDAGIIEEAPTKKK